MNFNVGKLYQIKKWFWMVYPTKDIAAGAGALGVLLLTPDYATDADASAAYLSRQYNCNVTYIPENSIFCLLEKDGRFLKVLSTNGEIGWIFYPESEAWTKGCIEKVNQ